MDLSWPSRLCLVTAVACALLVACDAAGGTAGPGVADLLSSTPGAGLPSVVLTEQQLDVGDAGSALPTDSAPTSAELTSERYRDGYIRIWGSHSNYATMAVLSFDTVVEASAFREFERKSITAGVNTYVAAHSGIPGSFVFVISAPTKQAISSDPVFCNGVWFALQAYAFESLACGATPAWATQAEEVAQTEYQKAKSTLG